MTREEVREENTGTSKRARTPDHCCCYHQLHEGGNSMWQSYDPWMCRMENPALPLEETLPRTLFTSGAL